MLGALLALPGIARDFKYTYEGQTLTYTVLDEEAKPARQRKERQISGETYNPPGIRFPAILSYLQPYLMEQMNIPSRKSDSQPSINAEA